MTSELNTEKQTFKRSRSGTSNYGQEYEVKVLAAFSVKLLDDPSIKDFQIYTNVKNAGKFDDLQVICTTNDGIIERYAFQVKHKDTRQLGAQCLEKSNDFGLSKFFESYAGIKEKDDFRFVLFTNGYLPQNIQKNTTSYKIIEDGKCPGKKYFFLPEETGIGKVYNFEVAEPTAADSEEKREFFKKFALYTYQKNWKEMETFIDYILEKHFSLKDITTPLIDFFRQLNLQQYTSIQINKSDLIIRMLDLGISRYIPPSIIKEDNGKFELLESAIQKFDFTVFDQEEKEVCENFLSLRYTPENEESLLRTGQDLKFLTRESKLDDFENNSEIRNKLGYYIYGQPLIVNINEPRNKDSFKRIISKLKKTQEHPRFILIGGQLKKEDFSQYNVFETLHDLFELDRNLYQEIIRRCRIRLFHQEYSYKELFDSDYDVAKRVTVKHIYLMLKGEFCIENISDNVPDVYIPRTVSATHLQLDSLKRISKDILVLSCKNYPKIIYDLEPVLDKNYVFIKASEYLREGSSSRFLVIYEDTEVSTEVWNRICDRNPERNIHHLAVFNDMYLRWISSRGSVKELRNCGVTRSFWVDECEIHTVFQNELNVLIAQSGAGKSELLKNFRHRCPLEYVPIMINFKEHVKFFKEKREFYQVLNHFLKPSSDNYFLKKIMEKFTEKQKIMFFLDGLDELNSEFVNYVLDYIKELARNFRVWISSRPHLLEKIENELNVFSVTIKHFTELQQQKYIKQRFQDKISDIIVGSVYRNLSTIENSDILGLPLQLFMITETILQKSNVVEDNMFVLTHMFSHFIDARYDQYFKDNHCHHSSDLQRIIRDSKVYRTEQYSITALNFCLPNKHFRRLNVKCDKKFLQNIHQEGDFLGILSSVATDTIIFNHNFHAEYFAALWLAENYHHDQVRAVLEDNIFKEEYRNIKFMFDMILADHCPAQLAVLYKNIDKLRNCGNEIHLLDKGRRSILHLVCSHICKYPDTNDLHHDIVKCDVINNVRKSDQELRNQIEIILEFGKDPLERDSIFQWTAIDYLDKTFFLLPLELILQKLESCELFQLNIIKNRKKEVIYYSALFNYSKLFEKVLDLDIFTKEEAEHLLYLAVAADNWKAVKILLDRNVDVHCRTVVGKRTPMHIAALYGHSEIIRMLHIRDADVNTVDEDQRTPLHLAAAEGHRSAIYELFTKGAELAVSDKFKKRPFHLAVENGKLDAIELLIDKVDIDETCIHGWTPLHLAVYENHENVVNLLLEYNADFNKTDSYGCKPVHLAAKRSNIGLITLFLEKSGNVDDLTVDGRSCLHLAAEFGHIDVVKFLLDSDANVDLCDSNGNTPIYYSEINENIEVANILKSVSYGRDGNGYL